MRFHYKIFNSGKLIPFNFLPRSQQPTHCRPAGALRLLLRSNLRLGPLIYNLLPMTETKWKRKERRDARNFIWRAFSLAWRYCCTYWYFFRFFFHLGSICHSSTSFCDSNFSSQFRRIEFRRQFDHFWVWYFFKVWKVTVVADN